MLQQLLFTLSRWKALRDVRSWWIWICTMGKGLTSIACPTEAGWWWAGLGFIYTFVMGRNITNLVMDYNLLYPICSVITLSRWTPTWDICGHNRVFWTAASLGYSGLHHLWVLWGGGPAWWICQWGNSHIDMANDRLGSVLCRTCSVSF